MSGILIENCQEGRKLTPNTIVDVNITPKATAKFIKIMERDFVTL